MRLSACLFAAWFGLLPGLAVAEAVARQPAASSLVLLGVSGACLLLARILLTWRARRRARPEARKTANA